MDKIIGAIPVYHLLTQLIPGTLLAILLKYCTDCCDVFSLTKNIWQIAIILYFLGIINSRLGSLLIEPLLKKLHIVKFVPYKEFVKAEMNDSTGNLVSISRMNNEYRGYLSAFILTIIIKLFLMIPDIYNFATNNMVWIILIGGIILFLLSYIKQVNYIISRVKTINDQIQNG